MEGDDVFVSYQEILQQKGHYYQIVFMGVLLFLNNLFNYIFNCYVEMFTLPISYLKGTEQIYLYIN